MLLFLVIAALVISALIIVAYRPVGLFSSERGWTEIDHPRAVDIQTNSGSAVRWFAIVAIILFAVFVFGVINFETMFESRVDANRQLIEQRIERERELRQSLPQRPGIVPPRVAPEQPRP